MTDGSKTLIAALLDRSGSMSTSKEATEEGWKGLIEEQKKVPGQVLVTLAQFDDHYDHLYSNLPITQLPEFVLQPRGSTALLDATGKFITEIGVHLAGIPEDDRPGTVICMIMTDGHENASREWGWDKIKELITNQRDQWNWQFLFLGANMDAVQVGAQMGFSRGQSMTYDANNAGAVMDSYAVASASITNTRSGLAADFTDEDRARAMGKKDKVSSGGKKK